VTRYKVELEIAIRDGEEQHGQESFTKHVGMSIPAKDDFSITQKPTFTEVEPDSWVLRASKWKDDERWMAIIRKVREMCEQPGSPHRMRMRGSAWESEPSGARKPWVHCKLEVTKRDAPDDGTYEMFILSAGPSSFHRDNGKIQVDVDGPYIGYSKDYWEKQIGNPRAIITPDWVHRTVHKDDPEAVRHGGGGHGGAEFRFKIESLEMVQRMTMNGIKVEPYNAPGEGEQQFWVVVTHNCWYQGVIPPQMREHFKINAEMVTGFNPGRTN
jgi:hypothetical protein